MSFSLDDPDKDMEEDPEVARLKTAKELSNLVCLIYNHQAIFDPDERVIWTLSKNAMKGIECLESKSKFDCEDLKELCAKSAKKTQVDRMSFAVAALIIQLFADKEKQEKKIEKLRETIKNRSFSPAKEIKQEQFFDLNDPYFLLDDPAAVEETREFGDVPGFEKRPVVLAPSSAYMMEDNEEASTSTRKRKTDATESSDIEETTAPKSPKKGKAIKPATPSAADAESSGKKGTQTRKMAAEEAKTAAAAETPTTTPGARKKIAAQIASTAAARKAAAEEEEAMKKAEIMMLEMGLQSNVALPSSSGALPTFENKKASEPRGRGRPRKVVEKKGAGLLAAAVAKHQEAAVATGSDPLVAKGINISTDSPSSTRLYASPMRYSRTLSVEEVKTMSAARQAAWRASIAAARQRAEADSKRRIGPVGPGYMRQSTTLPGPRFNKKPVKEQPPMPKKSRQNCQYCDYSCTDNRMEDHMITFHRNGLGVSKKCQSCEFTTTNTNLLKDHRNGQMCPFCSWFFPACQKLPDHCGRNQAGAACAMKCSNELCDYRTKDPVKLRQHEANHSTTKTEKLKNFKIGAVCPYCPAKIADAIEFNAHLLEQHPSSFFKLPQVLQCSGNEKKCEFRCARIYEMIAHWEGESDDHGEPTIRFDYMENLRNIPSGELIFKFKIPLTLETLRSLDISEIDKLGLNEQQKQIVKLIMKRREVLTKTSKLPDILKEKS